MLFTVSLTYSEIILSMLFAFLHEITWYVDIQTPDLSSGKVLAFIILYSPSANT